MAGRSYLSIGDVLTLLRQEFPDVTISKIRFLESQGLVNPERTPSGYRKFYEADVERLRWVLRQQREHFLPLKVIKDRLEDGAAVPSPEQPPVAAPAPEAALVGASARAGHASSAGAGGQAPAPAPAQAPSPASSVPRAPAGTGAPPATAPPVPHPAPAPDRAPAPPRAPATPVAQATGGSAPTAARAPETPRPAPAAPTGATPRPATPRASAPVPTGGSVPPGQPPAAPQAAPTAPASPPSAAPQAPVAHPAPPAHAAQPPAPQAAPARPAPGPGESDAAFTLAEFVSATGLPASTVEQLRGFGLITPSIVGGAEIYDEHALAVANVAAAFARLGVEPRHLRLYKNAADREVGFVEQVVVPLLRQRNPEARSRAEATAGELVGLGHSLLTLLVSGLLRDVLGR